MRATAQIRTAAVMLSSCSDACTMSCDGPAGAGCRAAVSGPVIADQPQPPRGSIGGPYLLACAALLPDLVAAGASLASPAPYGAEGLDWFAGRSQGTVDWIRLVFSDPVAARAGTDKDREMVLAASASDLVQMSESRLSPADRAVWTGELAEFSVYTEREGLAPGSQGWWDDDRAGLGPWGFELADISVPVLLMHGRQDRFVPFAHGQWLATHIPGVEARLLGDDGHLTLEQHRIGEVHSWLSAHL